MESRSHDGGLSISKDQLANALRHNQVTLNSSSACRMHTVSQPLNLSLGLMAYCTDTGLMAYEILLDASLCSMCIASPDIAELLLCDPFIM